MPREKVSAEEFVRLWGVHGNATSLAAALETTERAVYLRCKRLRDKGHHLPSRPAPGYESQAKYAETGWTFPREKPVSLDTGCAVIFSDVHRWPGEPTIAERALMTLIPKLRPRLVVANGDVFDGGGIGRHDKFGWCEKPSVKQELEACQTLLGGIEQAVPRGCQLLYSIGNHEIRFERNLATAVPDYANLVGFRLADHFDAWDMAWSFPLNWETRHPVMIKHRNKGGVHAGHNNAVHGGVTMVTGHTHILEAAPFGNYRTPRYWGVQTGTLQNLDHAAFEYMENGPPGKACSGFVVLNFKDGELAPPELVQVINGKAWFRGQVVA